MTVEFDAFLQPLDIYQQYKVLAEILQFLRQELKKEQLRVLLVGGVLPEEMIGPDHVIRGFLPQDEVVVTDPYCDQAGLRDIQALIQLPLKSDSFDVSVILDGLVTYGSHERKTLIEELIRTAKHIVIIGSPFNSSPTRLAEQFLHEYAYATYGRDLQNIRRHTQVGLPEVNDIFKLLHGRQLDYKDFPSGDINLWLSLQLLKQYLESEKLNTGKTLQQMVDRYYNENFYCNDHKSPSYRQFIVVNKNKSLRTVQTAHDFFRSRRRRKDSDTDTKESFFLLMSLINLWSRREQVDQHRKREEELTHQIDELQKQLLQFEKKVAGQRQSITDKDGMLKGLTETLREKDREILSQSGALAKREEEILQLNRQVTRIKNNLEGVEETEKHQREIILESEKDILTLRQQLTTLFSLFEKTERDLQRIVKNPVIKFTVGSEIERISHGLKLEVEFVRDRLKEMRSKD